MSVFPLLSLPLELLQHVLRLTDPGTFSLAIRSCRSIRDAGTNDTELLMGQLYALPGDKQALRRLGVDQLRRTFTSRARRNLSGLDLVVDVEKFDTTIFHAIDVPRSTFQSGKDPYLLLVCHDEPVIQLYQLEAKEIRHRASLRPEFSLADLRLLRVAMNGKQDVAGLYECKDTIIPASRHSTYASPFEQNLRVVTYHNPGPGIASSGLDSQEVMEIQEKKGHDAVALAIANSGTIAISSMDHESRENSLIFLYRDDKEMRIFGFGEKLPFLTGQLLRSSSHAEHGSDSYPRLRVYHVVATTSVGSMISDLSFTHQSDQINLFESGFPVQWFAHDVEDAENDDEFRYTYSSLDCPFYGEHRGPREGGGDPCHKVYLAFMMQNATFSSHIVRIRQDDSPQSPCDHIIDLSPGRRDHGMSEEIRAQLDGVPSALHALGNRLAISPQGTRIAIANWRQLKIWVLEPKQLLESAESLQTGYYPASWYDDGDLLHLPPIEIASEGVIHRICFAGEDHLWALTDLGLVKWTLGTLRSDDNTPKIRPLVVPSVPDTCFVANR
ncbi:MAG: hypothetical protein M1837_005681 [Sclerophora amabilis]|nr:MAG: hypothetical protein M1837_005681 [Sclerophora amabilis]